MIEKRLILLTGAGFSRNWGGWLADEAFEYLLGCHEITPFIRSELWKSKVNRLGFEDTLRELRHLSLANPQSGCLQELRRFEGMLESMFNIMAVGFSKVEFEPGQDPHKLGTQPSPVRDFLCRFDAIFTLNQDTLLEQRYARSDLRDGSQGKWFGLQSPGLTELLVNGQKYQNVGQFSVQNGPYNLQERHQPYYKLHGSINWRMTDQSALLILGGDKGNDIAKSPLLTWYQQEFIRLTDTPARIMVIGYSFADPHINDLLIGAASRGAQFFIVDTNGVGAFCAITETNTKPSQLKMAMQSSVIGASRRYLKDSLLTDTVELSKIMRFCNGY
ncbi:SIR2 family protein [Tardiphaga sp. 11_C7_N12_6]|uniref:SIR2 family protein n=1 Tax=Tardiphaga sp. 11_C7_N12_6 TaxID=3240789 RepID=UPI003F26C06F